jgi:DNA-binding XRE family transcriptional regulator
MKTNLKEIRKAAGWSNADDFAESINIPPKTYRNYEQGVRALNLEVACEICNALGCTLNDITSTTVNYTAVSLDAPAEPPTLVDELVDLCSKLNEQQIELLVSTARNFAVANEKDGAGDIAHVERAGFAVR